MAKDTTQAQTVPKLKIQLADAPAENPCKVSTAEWYDFKALARARGCGVLVAREHAMRSSKRSDNGLYKHLQLVCIDGSAYITRLYYKGAN